MNIELQRRINRSACIRRYCELTGNDAKFREVSVMLRENGKWRYVNERAHDEFIAYISPAVERFCGRFFTDGENPQWLPHPIAIATHIVNGRGASVKACMQQVQDMALLSEVWRKMHDHGMVREAA